MNFVLWACFDAWVQNEVSICEKALISKSCGPRFGIMRIFWSHKLCFSLWSTCTFKRGLANVFPNFPNLSCLRCRQCLFLANISDHPENYVFSLFRERKKSGSLYPKNVLFHFENRSTGCRSLRERTLATQSTNGIASTPSASSLSQRTEKLCAFYSHQLVKCLVPILYCHTQHWAKTKTFIARTNVSCAVEVWFLLLVERDPSPYPLAFSSEMTSRRPCARRCFCVSRWCVSLQCGTCCRDALLIMHGVCIARLLHSIIVQCYGSTHIHDERAFLAWILFTITLGTTLKTSIVM